MISEQTPYLPPFSGAPAPRLDQSLDVQLTKLAHAARLALQSRRSNMYADQTAAGDDDTGTSLDPGRAQEDAAWIAHRRALSDVVREYTHQMRKAGQYPEIVLVAVKSTIRDVGTPMVRKSVLDNLVCDAAQWSIEAYFDAPLG